MSDNGIDIKQVTDEAGAHAFLHSFGDTARASAVYSDPVTKGEFTVITAAEVTLTGGSGYGGGEDKDEEGNDRIGSGGGGGGVATSRPVAAIIIGPDGVTVEPIIDVGKIAITVVSALAAIFAAWRQISRMK